MSKRKRPFGRPRRRCSNNIKMDFKGIGWEGVDWIDLAQDMDCFKLGDALLGFHKKQRIY
jgi:hypothetical protein